MVRIVSDTSTMYPTKEAREVGFAVSPLAVTIAGESYRELDEMSPARFVEIINQGNMPISSQPAIGEVMELYEEFVEDEILTSPWRTASPARTPARFLRRRWFPTRTGLPSSTP